MSGAECKIIRIDGEPGSGKTTFIGESDEYDLIVSATNASASNGRKRYPMKEWTTVHKLVWPHAKDAIEIRRSFGHTRKLPYDREPIAHRDDPALKTLVMNAPGNQPVTAAGMMSEALHEWNEGPCPVDLEEMLSLCKGSAIDHRFTYTLAAWLEAGAPLAAGLREKPYRLIAVDEYQDLSFLLLRCLTHLADELHLFGDPGQAIFRFDDDNILPPGDIMADEKRSMNRSFRCGYPLARVASRVLAPFYDRGDAWGAAHRTSIKPWDDFAKPPEKGLVLGYSNARVSKFFKAWDCRQKWVRATGKGDPDDEMVLAVVHNAKGFQADFVYILPWTQQWLRGLDSGNPVHLRQLYVMMTRARRTCFVPRIVLHAIERLTGIKIGEME